MKYFLFFLLCFQLSFSQVSSIVSYGEDLINENKLDEAISYFNENLKTIKSDSEKIELNICLADIYKLKLDYEKSNTYYSNAYKIIKETKNVQLEFLYYIKLGEFYRKRSLYTESVNELKKAENILKVHDIDEKYLTKYYNRKAALFTEHFNNNDSTIYYANKSLGFARKVNDKDNIFYSLLEIAGVYERNKDYKKAISALEEIIEFAKCNNMPQQKADAYISYIMTLARDNQVKLALEKALYAAEFSKQNNFLYNEIIFNENIQNLYSRLNNTEKAYEYLKYRLELTDRYNDLKNEEVLYNLEAKYKFKEKEDLIKIKNLEIKNKIEDLDRSNLKIYLVSGLFLITILITILTIYFLNKSKHQNKKLQDLSKQNQFLVSETNHRVNNNLQLVSLLIENNIRNKENSIEKSELNQLLTKVEAISSLHRHLYINSNDDSIDIKNYLLDIENNFKALFLDENIQIKMNLDSINIKSGTSLNFGLLLTELFINSMKHAFVDAQDKLIQVSLNMLANNLEFKYTDNGEKGKNSVINPIMVSQLCAQLDVDYKINTQTGFSLVFIKKNFRND
jgi:two-component sensor histidine kinase